MSARVIGISVERSFHVKNRIDIVVSVDGIAMPPMILKHKDPAIVRQLEQLLKVPDVSETLAEILVDIEPINMLQTVCAFLKVVVEIAMMHLMDPEGMQASHDAHCAGECSCGHEERSVH